MMNGYSLLEVLVAMSFSMVLLLSGYQAWDFESGLSKYFIERARPEQESNYRLLVVKDLVMKSSGTFRRDPMIEPAQIFFQDLQFQKEVRNDCFSLASPQELPLRFIREGTLFRIAASPVMKEGSVLLLAGANDQGNFDWNYSVVEQVTTNAAAQLLSLRFLIPRPPPRLGALVIVQIQGVLYQNENLYAMSPAGAQEPFFAPVQAFDYKWSNPTLQLHWKSGMAEALFTCTL